MEVKVSSTENHKKHADLQRPQLGKFGRNELAVLGTTCEAVQFFAETLIKNFPDHRIAFADADHDENAQVQTNIHFQQQQKGVSVFIPNINNEYQRRILLSGCDAIIVNGNHFDAAAQIVFCNPTKEKSLRKRSGELTNVVSILLPADVQEVPDYVKELVVNFADLPVFREDEFEKLASWYRQNFLKSATVSALILTGGKSIRMGTDKSKIKHHGVEQYLHLYNLLKKLDVDPYISCRKEQSEYYENSGCKTIIDKMLDIGPLGGIMSAFMMQPDRAWMVLATDVPLIDDVLLNELIASRRADKVATAFKSPFDKFPEPLIAIWEPKSYPLMLQFMAQGYSCPRKVLINTDSHVVDASTPWKLENVNTTEDLEDLKPRLETGQK